AEGAVPELDQRAVQHGDDEQRAVRPPAEPGWPRMDMRHGLAASLLIYGDNAMRIKIGEPEPPLMPARPFGKGEPVQQHGDAGIALHRASSLSVCVDDRRCAGGATPPIGNSCRDAPS